MSASVLAGTVVTLLAAAWAGLLALAEETPSVSRTLGELAPGGSDPGLAYRAIYVSRLALLFCAGVALASVAPWWGRPPVSGVLTAVLGGALVYMVAEALPRAAGTLAPDLAAAAAPLAGRSVAPFRPMFALAHWAEGRVTRLFPRRRPASDLGPVQRDLLLGVFSLGDTTVAEAMTPRLDIMALGDGAEWNEVVDVVRRYEHSRIPVYGDTLDNISGILYAKDLVPAVAGVAPKPARWQDLIRPVQFVPESKSLAAQLRDFQLGSGHLAVVVDEFGGTSGLITLEDTLEEVVGEIRDEYDVDEKPAVEREGDDKFWVDGALTLDELSALLGVDLESEDVSTVGGLVYSELGHVPRPGETFQLGRFRVVVEQIVRRRILRVYFERQAASGEPARDDGGPA